MTDRDELIGQALRSYREVAGLTQSDLADHLTRAGFDGIYPQTIVRVEKGQRVLKLSEAVVLAARLGISVQAFVEPIDRAAEARIGLNREFHRVQSEQERVTESAVNLQRARLALARYAEEHEREIPQASLDSVRRLLDDSTAEFAARFGERLVTEGVEQDTDGSIYEAVKTGGDLDEIRRRRRATKTSIRSDLERVATEVKDGEHPEAS